MASLLEILKSLRSYKAVGNAGSNCGQQMTTKEFDSLL